MEATGSAPTIALPTCPYPGLRPFLDYEAALLFGRTRQVREVIERLRQTQFVAVIGGSGSGKSSLVLAGVVPELRSFGIPDAGDFWIPMVCTPGTNASGAESVEHLPTPITRLAWKFSKLLKPRGTPQADADRVVEIAEVFRQEAGFARLVDTYAADLRVAPGLAATDARLLFVIDQFEELFHPTNKGVEDCRLMVERVIEHFFSPHPRGYVVLTMRSEHLNDCAGYLELPDAINKSSYLVRRLDEDEIRDAIVGPAQRYLRLVARQAEHAESLPDAVRFDDEVLRRVQRDVKAITHDPDHLPLLQHLLARLWDAGLARAGGTAPVPSDILWTDLERAVSADAEGAAPLDENVNVLRACLESWPERLYLRHPENERAQLDSVLRQLAFKDPNTGMYTQQRINVDECTRFLGDDSTREDLWALIKDDFVGSVDYLFWDDEHPERITLKVSHESFIRGWSRLRRLIDEEAERFEEFVAVLRKCGLWAAQGKPRDLLLESADLRRFRDANLERVMSTPQERARWFRFLLLDRDGARLARCERDVDQFLRASSQRQQQSVASRNRNRVALAAVGVMVLMLAPIASFSFLVQQPVMQRAGLFFDANSLADQAQIPDANNYPTVGGAAEPLASLVRAAEKIEQGKSGAISWRGKVSEYMLDHFAWLPAVDRDRQFLERVAQQAEPRVNGVLRSVLTNALWTTVAKPPSGSDAFLAAPRHSSRRCTIIDADEKKEIESAGQLFVGTTRRGTAAVQRAIFVTDSAPSGEIVLRAAGVDSATGRCVSTHVIMPVPRYREPGILFDANLRYLLISTEAVGDPAVTLYEINWERSEDGSGWGAQLPRALSVVTDPRAVTLVRREAGASRVMSLETWRTPGGRAFTVAGESWRTVSTSAQRLDAKPEDFIPLHLADKGSACADLGESQSGLYFQRDFNAATQAYHDGEFEHCYLITRGNPASSSTVDKSAGPGAASSTAKASTAQTPAPRDEVLIAVYPMPRRGGSGGSRETPTPIASLEQFGRYEKDQNRWYVGVSGQHQGWIALRRPTRNEGDSFFGAPWSTGALLVLANDVLSGQEAKARIQANRAPSSSPRVE